MKSGSRSATNDEGYLLLGLVVVCFLLLLTLGVAAPRVAKQLERDREVESEHRAQEYVRAIQLYYRRNQRLPTSVEQLLGAGTTGISSAAAVRYLRQQYKDPLTKDDYRLIHIGEAKTEVKGFFGEPLRGMPMGNLGAAAGMQSNPGGSGAAAIGGSTPGSAAGGAGFSLGGGTFGSSSKSFDPTASGTTASTSGSSANSGTTSNSGTGSSFGTGNDATTFQGSKGAFLGVASNAKGHGLVEWNGSENIEDWEFLYDPRIELLKAKVSFFGGSPAASGSGSLGGSMGAGSTSIFGNGTSGANGTAGSQSGTGSTSIFAPQTGTTGSSGSTTLDTNGTTPR